MPKPLHLLLLSERADALERVYETPLGSSVTLTLAPDPARFLELGQKHPYRGFIVDVEAAGRDVWRSFQEIKLRQPTAFFAFLTGKTPEEGLRRLAPGGWLSLHKPWPLAALAGLKGSGPAVFFEGSEAPKSVEAEDLKNALRGAVQAASLEAVSQALAKEPRALAVLHVPRPETALGAFLLQTLRERPEARVVLACDQTLDESARHAVNASGWVALPAPFGLPYLLDRAAAGGGAAAAKERILVVDDEPNILNFVVDILSEGDYEVEGYESGAKALAAMKSKQFDVALVDFQLGDMTGLTLAREFRQIDPDLNVILMTAHASLDMAVKAIQADIYDYLIKPVDTSHLKRSLGKALEKRRLALEIKALVADLQKANHQLNRLNELKSRFLSIVTHDLRTPLTSIKGYSQVLTMQKNLPPDQQEHFLKVITHEADHLGGLISDLMDFVSIEAGKLRVERVPSSLTALVDALRNRMAALAEQRKVRFQVDVKTPDLPEVELDKRRIDQVLTNLVTNAFKHTPEGGSVTVEVEKRNGMVRLQVADTGEGIPPGDLPRIFEQFYQVEAHASKKDGIGLGLSIAKEIVQAHGGEIGVHSDGPGKGSRFWFTLPAS
jgi:signal transduction histidine kinase